jgi:hypothetical protein
MLWNRRINMVILILILIILLNVLSNMYQVRKHCWTSFSFKISLMKWYKKIPYVLWHWLTMLTYHPHLYILIYFISCVIIYCIILAVLGWLIEIQWLFAIIVVLLLASAAVFYTNCIYSLLKRKKKKKTDDNK